MVEEYLNLISNSQPINNTNLNIQEYKLDDEMKIKLSLNPNPTISGTMSAEIIDFAVIDHTGKVTSQLHYYKDYSIIIKVKFHNSIINPNFAFYFKTLDGFALTGCEAINHGVGLRKYEANEVVSFKFTQQMILNGGQYLFSVSCKKQEVNGLTIFHRIGEALIVDVLTDTPIAEAAATSTVVEEVRLS